MEIRIYLFITSAQKVIQEPGEYILTFARGFHQGFNFGFNLAEAINFGSKWWLENAGKFQVCKCTTKANKGNIYTAERLQSIAANLVSNDTWIQELNVGKLIKIYVCIIKIWTNFLQVQEARNCSETIDMSAPESDDEGSTSDQLSHRSPKNNSQIDSENDSDVDASQSSQLKIRPCRQRSIPLRYVNEAQKEDYPTSSGRDNQTKKRILLYDQEGDRRSKRQAIQNMYAFSFINNSNF